MGKKIKKAFKSVAKVVKTVADPLNITGINTPKEKAPAMQETVLAAAPSAAATGSTAPQNAPATQADIDAEVERKRKEKGAALAQNPTGTVGQPLGTKTMLGG